jgi:hypothetical protein
MVAQKAGQRSDAKVQLRQVSSICGTLLDVGSDWPGA